MVRAVSLFGSSAFPVFAYMDNHRRCDALESKHDAAARSHALPRDGRQLGGRVPDW